MTRLTARQSDPAGARYAIKLTCGAFINDSASLHWTFDASAARRFDYMTVAMLFATERLHLNIDEFTVVLL